MKDLFTYSKGFLFLILAYALNLVANNAPPIPFAGAYEKLIATSFTWMLFFIFCTVYFVYVDKRKELVSNLKNSLHYFRELNETLNKEAEELDKSYSEVLSEKQTLDKEVKELREKNEILTNDLADLLKDFERAENEISKVEQVLSARETANKLLNEEVDALKKALDTEKKKLKAKSKQGGRTQLAI